MAMESKKKTLCFDLDGVLYSYKNGYGDGTLTEGPMEGAVEAWYELEERYELIIYTARTDLGSVREWMIKHFDRLPRVYKKPRAMVYLDDHAVRFNGWNDFLNYYT
jgi:hypothetical protein